MIEFGPWTLNPLDPRASATQIATPTCASSRATIPLQGKWSRNDKYLTDAGCSSDYHLVSIGVTAWMRCSRSPQPSAGDQTRYFPSTPYISLRVGGASSSKAQFCPITSQNRYTCPRTTVTGPSSAGVGISRAGVGLLYLGGGRNLPLLSLPSLSFEYILSIAGARRLPTIS